MKLIIQIPCLNEAESLPATLAALPQHVEGFDEVEVMVIDDGSTDNTMAVAKSLGVKDPISLNGHQGLARAFLAGLVAAVERGADVIVNTDADNQYQAGSIEALVKPIVEKRADIVVGARPIPTMRHFSPVKRWLQRLGSGVVRGLSGTDVSDAPSGFRAMTREVALRLSVFGDFTYTIETIIQAGLGRLRVVSVPVGVNATTRPSRLFRSNWSYVCRSLSTMTSAYLIDRPTRLFSILAIVFFVLGSALGVRYLILMGLGEGRGHIQSVIACSALILCSLFTALIGVLAHLLSINRRLLEEVRYLVRTLALQRSGDSSQRLPLSSCVDVDQGFARPQSRESFSETGGG
jgi:glycosyltransferase involved in cell wall biosynthesis